MEVDYADFSNSSLNSSGTEELEYTEPLHPLLGIQCVVLCVCMLVGLLGHAAVAVLVVIRPSLQTISNLYILNYAISNSPHLLLVPLIVFNLVQKAFTLGRVVCIITSCFVQVPILTNSMFLMFITIDCYLNSRQKHHNHNDFRWKMLKVVMVLTWAAGGLFIIPIYFTTEYVNDEDAQYCIEGPLFTSQLPLNLICIFLMIMVPLIFMWVYVSLSFPPGETRDSPGMESRPLVVALTLAFTLCQVPYWLNQFLGHIHSVIYLHYILFSFPEINLAINAILILIYNRDLRQELVSCLPTPASRTLALDTL